MLQNSLVKKNMQLDVIKKLKQEIIKTVATAREGHLPSAFSILDILWVLYDKVLNVNLNNFKDSERDFFILSKGHASVGLYSVLAEKGFFSHDAMLDFAKFNSFLGGHPDRNKVPGVEASTGSLGHGFPMAVGAALGLKIKKSKAKVFVLIGDGEANEGTVWESVLLAAHHKLENLCLVVDYNHSTDRALLVGDLVKKFKSFDWDACLINGHDHKAILKALTKKHQSKPMVIVAETIKGYGCKSLEHNPAWHHRMPTLEEAEQLIRELE